MSDVKKALWDAFFTEVNEQLQELELSLARSDIGAEADVDSLFRLFHTIKSSAAMMEFSSMEAVAHACEDYLDLVRRGEAGLDAQTVEQLLRGVDSLKSQLATAEQTREDPPADDALLADLNAMLAGLGAENAGERGASADDGAGEEQVPAILEEFAATSRKLVPVIFAATSGRTGVKKHKAAIESLTAACEPVDFKGVAGLLMKLAAAPEQDPAAPGAGRRIQAKLIEKLRYAEQVAGIDCGVGAVQRTLVSTLIDVLRHELDAAIQDLSALYESLETAPDSAVVVEQETIDKADALVYLCRLIGYEASAGVMAMARQALRDIARGGLQADLELVEMVRIGVALAMDVCGEPSEPEHYQIMCQETVEEFRHVLSGDGGGKTTIAKLQEIRNQLEIGQDYLELLTPRAVADLHRAVSRHAELVEIEADLETQPELGEQFVLWLSEHGHVISNRTIFHRQRLGDREMESARLRFLVEMLVPGSELKTVLGSLDPSRRLFELHGCRYKDDIEAVGEPGSDEARQQAQAMPSPGASIETVRVDSETLDGFLARVGEMVSLRNMVTHSLGSETLQSGLGRASGLIRQISGGDAAASSDALAELAAIMGALEEQQEHLSQADLGLQNTLKRLQQDVLDLRVVPVALVFNRMPRIVRSICVSQGKEVQLEFEGEQSRIDKSMIERLSEPLMHIVRNSVDHGIEMPAEREAAGKSPVATLLLSARQQGNTMLIEVRDDGRGLNHAKIRAQAVKRGLVTPDRAESLSAQELESLIFTPGFSTAESITETSGRGVGLDVVKTQITRMGGQIEVQSQPGEGVAFQLRLPLSVAIQGIILVSAAGFSVAIAERNVSEVTSISPSRIQSIRGQKACLLRGSMLPVFRLSHLFGAADSTAEHDAPSADTDLSMVVVTNGVHRIGVLVDEVKGRHEAFVRELHPALNDMPGLGGTSILGDGSIAIIAEVEGLMGLARRRADRLYDLARAV